MNKRITTLLEAVILLILLTTACSKQSLQQITVISPDKHVEKEVTDTPNEKSATSTDEFVVEKIKVAPIAEYAVTAIPLAAELGWEGMEYSGMGWWQDQLVLLPQYPNGIDGNLDGQVYAISKQSLLKFAEGSTIQVYPYEVSFDDAGLSDELAGFEGFEAIVFIDNSAYLTIETHGGNPMKAFIIRGEVQKTDDRIVEINLEKSTLLELPTQNNNHNASYEALTSDGVYIYAFYEQNGFTQNESPFAVRLDLDLKVVSQIPVEAINYRVTDASLMDENDAFWMINYFFPGDTYLAADEDFLTTRYGLGKTHLENQPLERLVKFHLTVDGFKQVEQPPIYLVLLDKNEARNWEGLAVLDDIGFLLVTDKFPSSILALIDVR
ncbi:MAG: hypothetical protein AAGU15_02815 [Anaerolineaceae bacterium]